MGFLSVLFNIPTDEYIPFISLGLILEDEVILILSRETVFECHGILGPVVNDVRNVSELLIMAFTKSINC